MLRYRLSAERNAQFKIESVAKFIHRMEEDKKYKDEYVSVKSLIENGYPIGLLAPQYEQTAALFLQQLDDKGFSEPNDDGEIIIASRKRNYKKIIYIQDGKYDFEEEEN